MIVRSSYHCDLIDTYQGVWKILPEDRFGVDGIRITRASAENDLVQGLRNAASDGRWWSLDPESSSGVLGCADTRVVEEDHQGRSDSQVILLGM